MPRSIERREALVNILDVVAPAVLGPSAILAPKGASHPTTRRYKLILPEGGGGGGVETTLSMPVGEFPDGEDDAIAGSQPDRERRQPVPWYVAPLMALLAPALAAPFAWWLLRRRNHRPS